MKDKAAIAQKNLIPETNVARSCGIINYGTFIQNYTRNYSAFLTYSFTRPSIALGLSALTIRGKLQAISLGSNFETFVVVASHIMRKPQM